MHVQLWIVLIELGIGMMELGIDLRIKNARRIVLAHVSGLDIIFRCVLVWLDAAATFIILLNFLKELF